MIMMTSLHTCLFLNVDMISASSYFLVTITGGTFFLLIFTWSISVNNWHSTCPCLTLYGNTDACRYEGRPINKLQNSIILLIFKI